MAPQREWFEKDYYSVLGVPEGATDKEVSRAYKKLAKKYHPDANQGDAAAEERFKEVSAAYDVLGDAEKRSEYDEVRRMVAAGVGPDGGFGGSGYAGQGFGGSQFGPGGIRFDFDTSGAGDLFGGRSGRGRRGRGPGPQRGHDLETELHLGFLDAVHGATSSVRFTSDAACSSCGGSGARSGTQPEPCAECRGSGQVAIDQGPFSFAQVCASCGGRGRVVRDPCPSCAGRGTEVRPREVKVRIPAGIEDGKRIRVKGRGAAGTSGGPPGDLYVVVHVEPHPVFGRRGNDLTVRVPVSFAEATLGAEIKVPTLEEPVTVRIPRATPSGKVLRVRGRGVDSGKARRGDLLVTMEVQVPSEMTDTQRTAVESLAAAFAADPRAALFGGVGGTRGAENAGAEKAGASQTGASKKGAEKTGAGERSQDDGA